MCGGHLEFKNEIVDFILELHHRFISQDVKLELNSISTRILEVCECPESVRDSSNGLKRVQEGQKGLNYLGSVCVSEMGRSSTWIAIYRNEIILFGNILLYR